jgi:glucuronate isomerase
LPRIGGSLTFDLYYLPIQITMKAFLDENFLLQSKTAEHLYHEFASAMPIIDYHCHLDPAQIAGNINFANIADIWLRGDHYKWRAMRANGVSEDYITGSKSDLEKFEKWAETAPYTLRNPLYHWTHLELRRYFGITELLSPKTAKAIYEECTAKLQTPGYSVQSMITKMKVEVICTTDDPIDSLEYHQQIKKQNWSTKVYPAFRPDKAMNADDAQVLNQYIGKLEAMSDTSITTYTDYLKALKKRHDYFAENGCSVSDHGLEQIYAENFTTAEISAIFDKIRTSKSLNVLESLKFKTAMLYEFALWDHEKGWVQQYHLGALRNNNTRAHRELGPDTGYDSIGDFTQARALSRFLDKLDNTNQLAKTILYNLNPGDNELFATMAGNFNDGTVRGKIQFGSAWWFLDQKQGMTEQLNALSGMGLLSTLVGMLTDSRSFLSYPRHEYFRRLLCNLLATDMENGELPDDLEWTGKIVRDVCYFNANNYFNFK